MIEVGELKFGDKIKYTANDSIWIVTEIEYHRDVDDECEKIEIQLEDNPKNMSVVFTPLYTFEKIEGKKEKKQMFKLGDRVVEEHFGKGTIISKNDVIVLVEFDNADICLHDGGGIGKDDHCFWCIEEDLKEIKEGACKMTKKELYVNGKLFAKGQDKYRVIINDPAVILFVNNLYTKKTEKYVSKAHNEEFDPEKGLLMCLAKANGISHLDLKRMLKKATTQKKPESKVEEKEPVKQWTEKEILAYYRPQNKVEKDEEVSTNPKRFENEVTTEYKPAKSPCGKHRGKPYAFEIGDEVVVRDCYDYKHQKANDVLNLLNKELTVVDIFEDDFTTFYAVEYNDNDYIFAGSELEPVWVEY